MRKNCEWPDHANGEAQEVSVFLPLCAMFVSRWSVCVFTVKNREKGKIKKDKRVEREKMERVANR
jgi:hypothetical protein